MRTRHTALFASVLLIAGVALAACGGKGEDKGNPAAPTKVSLRLPWIVNAQFAGYYVAKDKGYFDDEGLNVTIRPGGIDKNPITLVASGADTFGLHDTGSLLLARSQDIPVVARGDLLPEASRRGPAVTAGRRQYHLQIAPGDVAPYVLLPGDPDRVGRIGKHLQEARGVADHREFRTWTGSYHGMPVSATSTGIGCPSAAIAVEELANVGATHFIRVGSTGALQPEMRIGDLVVTVGAMRNEGTSLFYVPDGFPAVADHFLTRHLVDAARDLAASRGFRLWVGLTASDDAFYGESPELIERMSHLGLLSLEMEASAIFTVAHRRGLQAASVCAVSGNLITGEVVYERENDRLARGWDDAIDVALEAVRAHHSTRDTER